MFALAHFNRWQAGGTHLLLSACLGAAVMAAMILVWYPPPYFQAAGGNDLVLLMLGVDVMLGPLLTLAVFDPGKGVGKLRFDLAVIGLLQLTALAYGVHVMFTARPAYLVFAVDRFDLVMANALPASELAKATPPHDRVPHGRPRTVGARVPEDARLREESLMLALGGIDLTQQPRFYVPYDEIAPDVARRARPFAELRQLNPDRQDAIAAALRAAGRGEDAVGFVPARAPARDFAVLVDKATGAILDRVLLRPW